MVTMSKVECSGEIRRIFTESQQNKLKHPKLIKKMKKLYDKSTEKVFTELFIECLKLPLSTLETCLEIENMMEFSANFVSTFFPFDNADETTEFPALCDFITQLIEFLLKFLECDTLAVRIRICQFFKLFLDALKDDRFVNDELIERIHNSLIKRLSDKAQKVRAQSVYALERLQDPQDKDCVIIKLYLFHLRKDPSAEVRKAIIINIVKNAKALEAVIKRINDVNDGVRKAAYMFISKIKIHSLKIKDRNFILREGLDDSSPMIRKIVSETLLPMWFEHSEKNFMKLLNYLDSEIFPETVGMILPILFDKSEKKQLIQNIPLNPDKKLIPFDKLNCDSVLYWKCLVEYFHEKNMEELIATCLPELSVWCDYIKNYQEYILTKDYTNTENMSHKFILFQLFEISKSYDLSDEVGRQNLKQVILHTLINNNCSNNSIESIALYCEKVIPDVPTRLNCLAHVINEIRMPIKQSNIEIPQMSDEEQNDRKLMILKLKMEINPLNDQLYELIEKKQFGAAELIQKKICEIQDKIKNLPLNHQVEQIEEIHEEKNDPETLVKCLLIINKMIEVNSIKILTPTLRSIFDNIVYPNIDHPNVNVRFLTLKVLGIYLLLDQELAKKHWMVYIRQFINENDDIWTVSIQCIFDLFLLYGFEYFNVDPDDDNDNNVNNTANESRRNRTGRTLYSNTTEDDISGISIATEAGHNNIVKIMATFLEHKSQCIRTKTTYGFCRLFLHQKLDSVSILSRLIILFHNPETINDTDLRCCLLYFFKNYTPFDDQNREILARTFFPILRILDNVNDESPLKVVDPLKVAQFVLDLTNTKINKSRARDYSVHNELTFSIIAEILTPRYNIEREILIRSLKFLSISYDVEQDKKDIIEGVKKIFNIVKNERTLKVCLTEFIHKIKGVTEEPEEQQQTDQEEEKNDEENEEREDEAID